MSGCSCWVRVEEAREARQPRVKTYPDIPMSDVCGRRAYDVVRDKLISLKTGNISPRYSRRP